MARPANTVETVSMTISVTPQLKHYLEVLSVQGIFGGGSPQDVAKHLLNNSIQELVLKGLLKPKEWVSTGEGKVQIATV
ncbi:hypothetical protein [Verrucomicrobium sp. BvORR106]|jgi:hypothetical protein|uniref:hypothetical protein n=1 Tax=Verrucomicrobium sp. BvORR106 TaxID=1403819 RepID=UPI00056EA197|nr:hypothetical protein [Verrucomicrobium sp. BvORR106]